MSKRMAIFVSSLVLLLGILVVSYVLKPTRLVVNGQEIPASDYVRIRYVQQDAEIPVLATFRALGYDAEIRSNPEGITQVVIDQEYVLFSTDDPEKRLGENSVKTAVRRIDGDEFIVDTNSIFTWLYWGWDIDIDVSMRKKTVYVDAFDSFAYTEKPARLVVNGKDLSQVANVTKREYYSGTTYVIPILAVLNELGAEISWEGDLAVVVSRPGKTFTFDLTEADFGYTAPPGGIGVRYIEGKELYMEYASVSCFLQEFSDATVRCDSITNTIYIKIK